MMYEDGTGGCDGCINFKGVGVKGPDPNNKDDYYRFTPLDKSDNNNMDQIVEKLELIRVSLAVLTFIKVHEVILELVVELFEFLEVILTI